MMSVAASLIAMLVLGGSAPAQSASPQLGISSDKFTIGGQPMLLLATSYFDGLGPGPVSVLASAPGFGAVHRAGARPGTDGLELRLSRAARPSGRVVGDPLPECFVLTVWRLDPESARFLPLLTGHGEGAAFKAERLSPGTYRLNVEAEGFETLDEPEIRLGQWEVLAAVNIHVRKRKENP